MTINWKKTKIPTEDDFRDASREMWAGYSPQYILVPPKQKHRATKHAKGEVSATQGQNPTNSSVPGRGRKYRHPRQPIGWPAGRKA